MNFRINFASSRVFWGVIAGAALLIILLLALWVFPAIGSAGTAAGDWNVQLKELETLQADASKIPSAATLSDRQNYRSEFVAKQLEQVRSFFADRTKLVEASIAGQGPVAPGDFKNAYILQVDVQSRDLARSKIVQDTAKAYKIYPWSTSQTAMPDPGDYTAILRDYWTRYHLYRIFMGKSGAPAVAQVNKLDVKEAIPIEHAPDFEGIPFQTILTLDPRAVASLVNALLAASPTVTDRPIFQLTNLKLAPGADANSRLCTLTLDGYLVLLKSNEKPAPAKTGGAKGK